MYDISPRMQERVEKAVQLSVADPEKEHIYSEFERQARDIMQFLLRNSPQSQHQSRALNSFEDAIGEAYKAFNNVLPEALIQTAMNRINLATRKGRQ